MIVCYVGDDEEDMNSNDLEEDLKTNSNLNLDNFIIDENGDDITNSIIVDEAEDLHKSEVIKSIIDESKSLEKHNHEVLKSIVNESLTKTNESKSKNPYYDRFQSLPEIRNIHKYPKDIEEACGINKPLLPKNTKPIDVTQYLIDEDAEYVPFKVANKSNANEPKTKEVKSNTNEPKTSYISISPHIYGTPNESRSNKSKLPQFSLTQHLNLISEPPSKLPPKSDLNINISISMFSASRFTATAGDLISRIPYYSETKEYITDTVSTAIHNIPGKKYLSKAMNIIKSPIKRYKNYKHSLSYKPYQTDYD